VRVCRQQHDQPLFSVAGRGIDAVVRHYAGENEGASDCLDCRQCISVCPSGALKWRQPMV
jgi:predicted molibdopterin-dependent oxidoreductase YjgC